MATRRSDLGGADPTPAPSQYVIATDTAPITGSDFESASHRVNSDVTIRDKKRKSLTQVYATEQKISVMVAPMYAAHFGKIMHVSINGISIAVPCNGKPYSIPKTFASEVHRRLRAINEQQQKQKRFADVASNYERSPGELALY